MLAGPRTKAEFYRRHKSGEFGNSALGWKDVEEALASPYRGTFTVRSKQAGTRCDYGVTRESLAATVQAFLDQGLQVSLNATMPDDKLLLQGEVAQSSGGLFLRYSTLPLPMRQALAQGEQVAERLRARCLLRSVCDAPSYEHLMGLLATYYLDAEMSSVVEFSTYSVPVGTFSVEPHRHQNTVIWEVRNY